MHSLERIENINLSSSCMMDLLKLYQFKGKEYYYREILKRKTKLMVASTIERDTFYLQKLLDLDISDYRLKVLIKKDGVPKNQQEEIVSNIKDTFKKVQNKLKNFELISNEIFSLGRSIFGNKNFNFKKDIVVDDTSLFTQKRKKSRRENLDKLLELYHKKSKTGKFETTQLITCFFVDFVNMQMFEEYNYIIGLYVLYISLYKSGFKVFKYISFFQMVYENKEEIENAFKTASLNWNEGIPTTQQLNQTMIKMLLKSYSEMENIIRNLDFDKKTKKTDDIENTILRLPQVFTKEQIRGKHPYVSDSTINRTLKRLRKEDKIRPNGTGRSASWIRIVDYERFDVPNMQLDLFQIMSDITPNKADE